MKKLLNKFLKSESGNMAVILGVSITPILMTTGVAIDYTGFKRMETRMEVAAEAAMLAGSKRVVYVREQDFAADGDYDMTNAQVVEELDSVFKPFFEANFNAGGYDLQEDQYNLEYIEADNNTKVLITMNYDTSVMSAFGTETLVAKKEMTINLKVQPRNYVIDIVMCIDATGSMQNTLNAVQANAMTFNEDLRTELGVGATSSKLKIRTRPIFYRDWEEGRDYLDDMDDYNAALAQYNIDHAAWEANPTGGLSPSEISNLTNQFNHSSWYYWNGWKYRKSKKWWQPKTHKRVKYDGAKYYVKNMSELNALITTLGGGGGTEPTPPTMPVNHGLNMYSDFIDLDPLDTETDDRDDRNTELTDFLGSTYAFGGHDWPEAAGACLNEAIRSNWYDNQSDDAKAYFNVPSGDLIIKENDTIPAASYTKITPIPVIVFWSDATINSLTKSRDYLSSTTPTSWSAFKDLWDDGSKIDQNYKMFIRFGPSNASGFNTIDTWDNTSYGGSLTTGNNDAVKVIAKQILESIPDLLRVGS